MPKRPKQSKMAERMGLRPDGYKCYKCKRNHRLNSKIGRAHLDHFRGYVYYPG